MEIYTKHVFMLYYTGIFDIQVELNVSNIYQFRINQFSAILKPIERLLRRYDLILQRKFS